MKYLRMMSGPFVTEMARAAVKLASKTPRLLHDPDFVGFVTSDDLRDHADQCRVTPTSDTVWELVFTAPPSGYEFQNTGAMTVSRYGTGQLIPIYSVTVSQARRLSA